MERGGQLDRGKNVPKKGIEKVKASSLTLFLPPSYGSRYVAEVRLTYQLSLFLALSVIVASHGHHLIALLLVYANASARISDMDRLFLCSWDTDLKSIIFNFSGSSWCLFVRRRRWCVQDASRADGLRDAQHRYFMIYYADYF